MYCFLINELKGGGAERTLQVLANHFCRQGQQVTILTLEDLQTEYFFDSRIRFQQLLRVPSWRWLRNLLLLPQWLALCWWLHRHKPRFCLSILTRSNLLNILAGMALPGVSCPITEHCVAEQEFPPHAWTGRVVHSLVRWLYPMSQSIFCVSYGVRDGLIRLGVPNSKLKVIPNPVDLETLAQVSPLTERSDLTPHIISVGRLVPEKDHALLLRAYRRVSQTRNVRLTLVGEGPSRAELEKLACTIDAERIHFTGWTTEVYQYLLSADVFVLPSRFESFGNAILEAMAAGLPVIGTTCQSGPREILEDGRWGLLVPPSDEDALVSALEKLLDDPSLRQHFAHLSRERAVFYSVERIADILESYLISDPEANH